MPRRKKLLRPRTGFLLREPEAYRGVICAVIGARNDNAFRRLSDEARQQLIDDLVHAVGHAKAGLILRGKRARTTAWTLDIFVKDVCDALKKVGMPVLMNSDPALSYAQSLAKEIAHAVGLRPGTSRSRLCRMS